VLFVVIEFHSLALLLSIFHRRQEMIKFKRIPKFVIVFAAFFGLVFVIGCGSSAEKQAASDLLQQYSQTVDKYLSADQSKKSEMEAEVDAYKTKWSNMKMEMDGQVTPQALDELDNEYKKITKKYVSLAGKS